MKRLQLPGAMLGLTVLLTACPGNPPPTPTHSLTVKLEGVPSAPVTVINTTTKAQVFSGTVEGSKTFSGVKAGDVLEIKGSAVNGYTAPAAQTVTLDANKTVTLAYTAAPVAPPAPTLHTLTVKLEGVPSAPVTITNTTTKVQVFSGTLEGSKTFGDLKAGDVFEVTGAAVNGFTAPGAQTVTLDASKTVTLAYTAAPVTPPAPTLHTLTVKLEGTGSAPVTVTNETTKTQVFSGSVEGSKTLENLKAGDVFRIEAGSVEDFAAPTAQTVTLDASKTVTLSFTALPGTALDPSRVRGTLGGWTFGTGELGVLLANNREFGDATTPTILPSGKVDAGLPTPGQVFPFLEGCTFTGERSAPDFGSDFAYLAALSPQGDFLGDVFERTVDGQDVLRVYSDTAATFKGTALCYDTIRLDLDLSVKRGWNAMTLMEVDGGSTLRVRTLEAGSRTLLSFERAGEQVDVYFRDQSELTLRAGQSAAREVVLGQTGGISGEVTLETSVPGVTVTPSSVGLPVLGAARLSAARLGQSGPGQNGLRGGGLAALRQTVEPQAVGTALTFSAAGGARGYTGPLDVIVKRNGTEVGRGTLYSFRLVAPSVSLVISDAHNGVNLYPGETSSLRVNVMSMEGFSGSTTLTLTGLPAGVTAPAVTAQVTPNTTTTVSIPVTAAADAAPGTSTVSVTSPHFGISTGPSSVQVTVRPARTAVGQASSRLARGGEGVWVPGQGSYDSGTSTYRTELTRYVGGQVAARATVPSSVGQILTLPGGDLVVPLQNNQAVRISDAGTVTPLTSPSFSYASEAAVDGQGRVWFVQRTLAGMGGYSSALARWTPETGEVVTVDSSQEYGQQGGRLVASNDGQTLVYLPTYSSKTLRIDARTGAVSPLGVELNDQSGSVAISDSGTLWFTQYGALKRVNADGSVTTFDGVRVERLFGFDRRDANILWGADFSTVVRIDARTGEATRISLGGVVAAVTLSSGGLSVMTSEYVNGQPQAYLSILR